MYVIAGLIGAVALFFGIYLNFDIEYFSNTFATKTDLILLVIMSIFSFIYYYKAFPNPDAQPQPKKIEFPFFKDKIASTIFILAIVIWMGKDLFFRII